MHRARASDSGVVVAHTRREAADEGGSDEGGSAAIEFILAGLILLVPLVYLVIALGQIQAHALGVEAGARHLARSVAGSDDERSAQSRAARIINGMAAEYGMDRDALAVTITCTPANRGPCPRAGAIVHVTVRADVALPLVPPVFGAERWARVPVEASGVHKVSRGWDP